MLQLEAKRTRRSTDRIKCLFLKESALPILRSGAYAIELSQLIHDSHVIIDNHLDAQNMLKDPLISTQLHNTLHACRLSRNADVCFGASSVANR